MKTDQKNNGRLFGKRPLFIPDILGLSASGLCLVHCAATPVLLFLLPGLAMAEAYTHPALAGLALLSTLLFLAGNHHRNHGRWVWVALAAANTLILVTTLLPHEYIIPTTETALISAASLCLMLVHYKNHRIQKHSCSCLNHDSPD